MMRNRQILLRRSTVEGRSRAMIESRCLFGERGSHAGELMRVVVESECMPNDNVCVDLRNE